MSRASEWAKMHFSIKENGKRVTLFYVTEAGELGRCLNPSQDRMWTDLNQEQILELVSWLKDTFED